MAIGQTGMSAVVQSHVVEGSKKNSDFVIIPHHPVVEDGAMGQTLKMRSAMSPLVNEVSLINSYPFPNTTLTPQTKGICSNTYTLGAGIHYSTTNLPVGDENLLMNYIFGRSMFG